MTPRRTVRERVVEAYAPSVFTRDDLKERGLSGRDMTSAVRSGLLTRIRQNRYAVPQTDDDVIEAVRIGGRLSCLSLLKSMGVFVHRCDRLHVHVTPGTSRIRMPVDKRTRLHWSASKGDHRALHAAPLIDAVRQAITCQPPRAAIATLDSLLHHGVLTPGQLTEVFDGLPARYGPLLRLVDASAESGPETFMRLLLRALGLHYRTQVDLPGIGRVDFLVEGWLIIECDSREFHEGWQKQVDDRRRDMHAAAQGYVTLRPLATEIMDDTDALRELIRSVVGVFAARFMRAGRS